MMFAWILALAVVPTALQAVRDLAALDLRVATIGDRLARSGLCRAALSAPGWVVQDLVQYRPQLRSAVREALRLGERPTVVALVPGGAAARARVAVGDQIEAVSGRTLGAAGKGYARMQQLENWVEQGLASGKVRVTFRRGQELVEVDLPAQPGCSSRFQLLPGRGLNARADGTYVQVSGELVKFVRNDDELALVMAHELAHNVLRHRVQLDAQKVSRGLFAGFGKNGALIRTAELEADRMALYLMARAGFDPSVAPGFWQRFGARQVPGFLSDGTHPGTGERVRRAEAEIARIRSQQAAGQQPTP